MPTKKPLPTPFTIQLPACLHERLVRTQKKRKLSTKTEALLYAIVSFDFTKLKATEVEQVQISARLPGSVMNKVAAAARKHGKSDGWVVRQALEALA